ncbi:hypothetical protein [Streptomyces sp. N35]|uniref:hypothetical protein n=1 Tax=Streptomyces sp. N35 TaxID=2795730 RepID=UPI0018F4A7CF|nr:hypothetical protein [Streptomyces sp. N35]
MDADRADDPQQRERARWWRDTGTVMLALAGGLWLWAAVLVVTSAPGVFGRCGEDDLATRGCEARDLGLPLLLLVLALPLAALGAMLYATFSTRLARSGQRAVGREPEDP